MHINKITPVVASPTKHPMTLIQQTVHLFHAQPLIMARNLAFAVVSPDLSETSVQIDMNQVSPRVQNKLKVVIQTLHHQTLSFSKNFLQTSVRRPSPRNNTKYRWWSRVFPDTTSCVTSRTLFPNSNPIP